MKEIIKYRDIRGNRKYKDSLFRMVFRKKSDLLELYNAINGTEYTNPDELEINTLENVLYITKKNDVSFIIDCTMNLYEHQSSYNPNMPLRGLVYFSKQYNKYVEQRKLNLFSTALQKIPTPKFVVFYNGLRNEPDRQILRLSDAFQCGNGCLECEATMLNINYGRNKELMEKCKRLEEYALFVACVRKFILEEKNSRDEAIMRAIGECVKKGILVDILTEQQAEVVMYILESFDKEIYERDLRAEAIAEGRAEGRAAVLKELISKKLQKGKNVAEIAEVLEEPIEIIETLIKELNV